MAMAFDPNRWTIKTQEAFQAAVGLARERNNAEVTPEHLLAALFGQGAAVSIYARKGAHGKLSDSGLLIERLASSPPAARNG